jgi:hypothetical protein
MRFLRSVAGYTQIYKKEKYRYETRSKCIQCQRENKIISKTNSQNVF